MKNSNWATVKEIPAPKLEDGNWIERPENASKIKIWENFNKQEIIQDFYNILKDHSTK